MQVPAYGHMTAGAKSAMKRQEISTEFARGFLHARGRPGIVGDEYAAAQFTIRG